MVRPQPANTSSQRFGMITAATKCTALVLLVFPDGRFLSSRWWNAAIALVGVVVAFNLLAAMSPARYLAPYEDAPHVLGAFPAAGYAAASLLPVFLGLLVGSVAGLVRRYAPAS